MTEANVQHFLVAPSEQNMRLDTFISAHMPQKSRSAIARDIVQGLVKVNNMPMSSKAERVNEGDTVSYTLIDDQEPATSPEAITLDIRFEDAFLGVIAKQSHLICHPSQKHKTNTLSQILEEMYGKDGLGDLQGEDRLGLVHRLDGDTSGLMLFAKDNETQEALQNQIRARTIDRRYITLVHGNVSQNSGLIEVSLGPSPTKDRYVVPSTGPDSREAITTFKTLARFSIEGKGEYTLLECHLYTGRTHQIRVHMDYIGHPVVGDRMYGAHANVDNLGLTRQFLHSWTIAFEHPHTETTQRLTCALPEDLRVVYNELLPHQTERTEYGRQVLQELEQAPTN